MMYVLDTIIVDDHLWRISTGVGAVLFVVLLLYLGNNHARKRIGIERWNEYLMKSGAINNNLYLPYQCFPTELELEKVYGQIQYNTKKFQTTEQPRISR